MLKFSVCKATGIGQLSWRFLKHGVKIVISPFEATVLFPYSLKISENQRSFYTFWGYRKGTLAWNALNQLVSSLFRLLPLLVFLTTVKLLGWKHFTQEYVLTLVSFLFTVITQCLLNLTYLIDTWLSVWGMKPQHLVKAYLVSEHANLYTNGVLWVHIPPAESCTYQIGQFK